MAFNKVILVGNLVEDPELKQTPLGVCVTSFRLAVARRFKNGNGETDTDFFTIVCWRATAEFVTKYFTKGKGILVCGQLQTRAWDDNGNKRYVTEVVADEVSFVERKSESSAPSTPSPSPTPVTTNVTTVTPTENAEAPYAVNYADFVPAPNDEDLPF